MDNNDILFEIERYRKRMFRMFLIFRIIGIIGIVAAIAMLIIAIMKERRFLIGTGIATIIYIAFSLIGEKFKNDYKKEIDRKVEKLLLDKYFVNYEYDDKFGIDLNLFMRPGFFARPSRYVNHGYLKSSYKGVNFERGYYDLQKQKRSENKDGSEFVTSISYSKGIFFCFHLDNDNHNIIKIAQWDAKYSNMETNKSLCSMSTNFGAFDNKFKVLTLNEKDSYAFLTGERLEKIIELSRKYKGYLYMAYIDSDIYIAINTDEKADIPINKKITKEAIDKAISYYTLPMEIIDKLKIVDLMFE